jgi:hypothetical protein
MRLIHLLLVLPLSAFSTGASAVPFKHPGILNNRAELEYIRGKVASGEEPWKGAFAKMASSDLASLARVPKPRAVVESGPYDKPDHGAGDERSDSVAAYTHALLWQFTGKKEHAQKAIEILNAWSAVLQEHRGSNAPLQAGWTGSLFPRAAEMIRHSDAGWLQADVERFGQMLRKAHLPAMSECPPDYNGNWELSRIEATIAIGVFLDDEALFNSGVAMWRKRVPAYFYLQTDGLLPVPPPGTDKKSAEQIIHYWHNPKSFVDGLCQESFRDFGHTQMGLSAAINAAEIAYHQGVNLYGEETRRLTTAMELHAGIILGDPVPPSLVGSKLKISRGQTWEIAYNHFRNRKGIELPQTQKLILTRTRPTLTGLMTAWETLTHAELGERQ